MVFFLPIKLNKKSKLVEKISKIKFWFNSKVKFKGVITAPIPIISNKFNAQDPIKFPMAKSVSFFITAIIEVTNSGVAVPIAITVKPITLSEILKYYEQSYPLQKDERKLLFILIALPPKIDFDKSIYEQTKEISNQMDIMYKTERLISPYYSK